LTPRRDFFIERGCNNSDKFKGVRGKSAVDKEDVRDSIRVNKENKYLEIFDYLEDCRFTILECITLFFKFFAKLNQRG
jgi:hypothetical protein